MEIEARKVKMIEVEEKRTKRESSKEDSREETEERKKESKSNMHKEERTREEKCIYKEIDERIRKKKNQRKRRRCLNTFISGSKYLERRRVNQYLSIKYKII